MCISNTLSKIIQTRRETGISLSSPLLSGTLTHELHGEEIRQYILEMRRERAEIEALKQELIADKEQAEADRRSALERDAAIQAYEKERKAKEAAQEAAERRGYQVSDATQTQANTIVGQRKEQRQLMAAIAKHGWSDYNASNPIVDLWEENPMMGKHPWVRIKNEMPEKFADKRTSRQREAARAAHEAARGGTEAAPEAAPEAARRGGTEAAPERWYKWPINSIWQ